MFKQGVLRHGLTSALLAAALVVGYGSTAASATMAHHAKALSLSQITWVGGATETFAAEVVAEAKGYFAQQGITSSTNMVNLGTPASWIATALAGGAQFVESSAGIVPSIGEGAPLRAIAMDQVPYEENIYVSQTFATAHNIPAAGNSVQDAIAQFKALKGTHITVDVSTVLVPIIPDIYGIAKKYGLTVGINSTQDDININAVGGAAIAEAAVESGKADAVGLSPPQPDIPVDTIPVWKIPPASNTAGEFTTTLISMIQGHPDTVQAVVTALTEATNFIEQHTQKAYSLVTPFFAAQGYPSSLWPTYYHAFTDSAWLEYPTKSAYDEDLYLINASSVITGVQTHLTYSLFADPKFAQIALKKLGLKVP